MKNILLLFLAVGTATCAVALPPGPLTEAVVTPTYAEKFTPEVIKIRSVEISAHCDAITDALVLRTNPETPSVVNHTLLYVMGAQEFATESHIGSDNLPFAVPLEPTESTCEALELSAAGDAIYRCTRKTDRRTTTAARKDYSLLKYRPASPKHRLWNKARSKPERQRCMSAV